MVAAVPPIAILGAGPAGLLLARILTLHSIPYTIFERDASPASFSKWGGTLDIHHNTGQVALAEAGLLDDFKRIARYDAQVLKIADRHANIVLDVSGSGDEKRPEIDRRDLRDLLLKAVPDERIRWGSKVAKVEREEDGTMTLLLAEEGKAVRGFKLVVGADGAWSKARSLVTAAKPIYAGNTFFTTSVSKSNPYHATMSSLVGPGMYLICDSGHQIIAQGLADGSYQINISLPVTEGWATSSAGAALIAEPQALRKFLLQFYADWAPTATDVIRKSDGAFRPWPLYSLLLEASSWKSVPGLTLVGDAAHLEIPDGEGVNRALTDGVSLARRIVAHYRVLGDEDGKDGDLDAAVREYEAEMLPRVMQEREENKTKVMLLWAADAPNSFVEAVMGGHVGQE
ncbi:hypothetical protein LTR91_015608 [Friedmanniomyces endolithicus]|uniref:FAD-binding domain-containing protein n=1 Tax=Friedmanniomyces endolithicus TaxID=329885 RepID=A0AAN6K9M8_9PEZI|nr:hypothetical protein LTR75_003564 [Friedmanniomyces endolithicus]KAK0857981.1 hypothetical protein LTR03_000548 [Friedmanniomyces endolithicus]KAK0900854.1 hypothetical protein LTR02_008942 [Friedmanniomyces endolithicus]KAK0911314.1 hypothetical protein LTR57_015451 [Friedmanniomyces endolithicus]KAK0971224.1 hypothetical protein LTR91_015608 [Friedmanniomyces endolithicus]